jgi:hypothetical protein
MAKYPIKNLIHPTLYKSDPTKLTSDINVKNKINIENIIYKILSSAVLNIPNSTIGCLPIALTINLSIYINNPNTTAMARHIIMLLIITALQKSPLVALNPIAIGKFS